MPQIPEKVNLKYVKILVLILICLTAVAKASFFKFPGEYQIILSYEKTKKDWQTAPLSVILDSLQLAKSLNIKMESIDPASFQVVAFNQKNEPIPQKAVNHFSEKFVIPCCPDLSLFPQQITLNWRTSLKDVAKFEVYFSLKNSGDKAQVKKIALVGNGDFLSFGRPGVVAPLSGGYNENVATADLDQDGIVDLLVGFSGTREKEGIYFYKNPGKEQNNVLSRGQKIYSNNSAFQLFDWDGDQQTELLLGGNIFKLKELTPVKAGALPQNVSPAACFCDWDGDGLTDMLATRRFARQTYPSKAVWNPTLPPFTAQGVWMGESARSQIVFYKNIGTEKNREFSEPEPVLANTVPIELYGSLNLTTGDLDGDGDTDLLAGNSFELIFFENLGGTSIPHLAAGKVLKAQVNQDPFGIYVRPRLADWDSDGDLDVFLGNEDGRPTWIENLGKGVLGEEKFLVQIDPDLDCGCLSVPVVCDWDGDGDLDLLSGNSSGFVEYFENTSQNKVEFIFSPAKRLTAEGKEIRILAMNGGSIQGPDEARYGYTMPTVADWDNDGDLDLLLSDVAGEHRFFKNTGSRKEPNLAEGEFLKVAWPGSPSKPSWVWWQPGATDLVTQMRCRPAVADWNQDGVFDYVTLDHEGYLACYEGFFKNGEKWLRPGKRCFKDVNGRQIRISAQAGRKSGRARIVLVDWDNDGDLDILHNAHNLFDKTDALLRQVKHAGWFENVGPATAPQFHWRGEIIKREIPRTSEHSTAPEPVDFDGDGQLDLLFGGEDGRFTCFHRAFIENDLPALKIEKIEKRK